MDAATANSLQFAFTIMFHYLFPIGTMGIAPFVAWYTYRAWRAPSDQAERRAAFWTRLFAINFAAGVVTGIPMEFQFGTNWAAFSAKAGTVIGQPLALEATYAFFLESVFLGVLLAGRHRVAPALLFVAAVCIWLGSWLSGYFIVVADAWMQHPVGYALRPDGQIVMTSLWALLTSRFAIWQYVHVLAAAVASGGFIVAAVGAYYVLAGREAAHARAFVRLGVLVALVGTVAVIAAGDQDSKDVSTFQPIKLAAMEGVFSTTADAPLAIIGMPDLGSRKLVDPIFVPDLLSFLAYGNVRANVAGLSSYTARLWPPVELTYYAYHIMVGLGTIFALAAGAAALLLFRDRLFSVRPLLWLLMLLVPFPYIANEAGWVTAEVGRQPWIVYGLMRTHDAASPNVFAGETIFTLIGFAGMYFLLGIVVLFLTLREIGRGPSEEIGAAPEPEAA